MSSPFPTVTLRYWAGAKAAAGVSEERYQASTLAAALAEARSTRDARFGEVLARCSYLVSEQPVGQRAHKDVMLREGDVVDVLPPFAGGGLTT